MLVNSVNAHFNAAANIPMRITSQVLLTGKDAKGRNISAEDLVQSGFIEICSKDKKFALDGAAIDLGSNMIMNNGWQYISYLVGGRSPASAYCVSHFGIGTATLVNNSTLTDLSAPVNFYDPGSGAIATKPVSAVDYPDPFRVQFALTLDAAEAVGVAITELGLYAYNSGTEQAVLFARKTVTAINKTADWSPTLLWQLKFG